MVIMVERQAPISTQPSTSVTSAPSPYVNPVLHVATGHLENHRAFGQNLIFVLNRTSNSTKAGCCTSLLLLKTLYLLLNNVSTALFFYINDLKVLVDVISRELTDLPDESSVVCNLYSHFLQAMLNSDL